MNTLQVKINGKAKTIVYPSDWNELNKRQLVAVASLFLQKLDEYTFRIKALGEFLHRKNPLFKHYSVLLWKQKRGLTHTDEKEMLDEIIFNVSTSIEYLFKSNTLTKQLIPKYKRYHAPGNCFSNMNIIEFSKAEMRFESYNNTHETKYLNEMIAILYRPSRFLWGIRKYFTGETDRRQKYSDKHMRNARKIAKWPLEVRYAIYLYFQGCREFITTKYPHVFKVKDDNEPGGFGYAGLIISLAGTKFGDTDKTAYTDLHTILIHLELQAIEYEKQTAHKPQNDEP